MRSGNLLDLFIATKMERMTKIWDAIEQDGYEKYDAFVSLIKDTIAPNDDEKAYKVEDVVNTFMVQMFNTIERVFV